MGMILVQGNFQFKHPRIKGITFVPKINDWQVAPDWIKDSIMFQLLSKGNKLKYIDETTQIESFTAASKDNGFESKISTKPESFNSLNEQIKSYEPPNPASAPGGGVIVQQHLETPDSIPIVPGVTDKVHKPKTNKPANNKNKNNKNKNKQA